jgi:hypothetical protein
MTKFHWNRVPTDADVATFQALTESLSPAFARAERSWWESQTPSQLHVRRTQAWDCADRTAYALARYYLARTESALSI